MVIGLAPEKFQYNLLNQAFRWVYMVSVLSLSQTIFLLITYLYGFLCTYMLIVIHFVLINSRLLMDGAPLIAIHKARYFKTSTGLALGPGMICENICCEIFKFYFITHERERERERERDYMNEMNFI